MISGSEQAVRAAVAILEPGGGNQERRLERIACFSLASDGADAGRIFERSGQGSVLGSRHRHRIQRHGALIDRRERR